MEIVRNNTQVTPTRNKFTRGPWKRDSKYSCDILAPDGELLASTYTMQPANGGFEAEGGNAQLMHVAPEMLEAIDALLLDPDDVHAWQLAQEASKKAHATN